jgi:hypothetical protein
MGTSFVLMNSEAKKAGETSTIATRVSAIAARSPAANLRQL